MNNFQEASWKEIVELFEVTTASTIDLSVPGNIFSIQDYVLCFLAAMLLFIERNQSHPKAI